MKKNLRLWVVAAVGAVASIAFTSCAYDPYYSSVGGSYSTGSGYGGGYGDGYGYGSSSFNTSVFISTGSPRWGYDPYSYCYYDYNRRAYYDPYLYGYYPIGYRPPVVYGVPHPHGWRPGRGYIAPPSRVSYGTVSNYRNRESAYRNTDYGWAKQVRQRPVEQGRVQGSRPGKASQYKQPDNGYRNSSGRVSPSRTSDGRTSTRDEIRPSSKPSTRAKTQSRYNSPVTPSQPQGITEQRPQLGVPRESRNQAIRGQAQPRMQSDPRAQGQARPQPQGRSQNQSRGQGGENRASKSDEDNRIRGYR